MKRTQSVFSEMFTSLVMVGLAWSVAACTYRTVNAGADSGAQTQMLASSASATVEPQYFGDQFASQQHALLAKPDESPVDTF